MFAHCFSALSSRPVVHPSVQRISCSVSPYTRKSVDCTIDKVHLRHATLGLALLHILSFVYDSTNLSIRFPFASVRRGVTPCLRNRP